MVFVSVTRLKLRSIRFLPGFILHALRTNRQAAAAAGFRQGSLLNDRHWTFWTLTTWDSQQSMRGFMTTAAHLAAMPRLLEWCDEASVGHWEQASDVLPSWPEAERRMRESGRPSKVRYPGPLHASMGFAAPRLSAAMPIKAKRAA